MTIHAVLAMGLVGLLARHVIARRFIFRVKPARDRRAFLRLLGISLAGAAVSNPGSRRDTAGTESNSENPQRVNRAMQPPARATVGKNVGLHLSWFVYRGAGKVTFDPPQIKSWEDTRAGANSPWAPIWVAPDMPADGKIVTHVIFAEPGTYVLRGLADDGALTAGTNATITVTAGPALTGQNR
jgi:hypothetical protein